MIIIMVWLLKPVFLLNKWFILARPYLDSGQNYFFHLFHVSVRDIIWKTGETDLPQMQP